MSISGRCPPDDGILGALGCWGDAYVDADGRLDNYRHFIYVIQQLQVTSVDRTTSNSL